MSGRGKGKGLGPTETNKLALILRGHGEIDVEAIEELIEEDPEIVNSKASYGEPVLHLAVSNGHVEAVRILLKHKAEVDATDYSSTPLFTACWNEEVEIVKELIAARANPGFPCTSVDSEEPTPFGLAIKSENMELFDEIIKSEFVTTFRGDQEENLLFLAASYSANEMVQKLIALGLNVNEKDNEGNAPLGYCGSAEVVKELLQHKADVNVQNEAGDTPLHRTLEIHGDQTDITKALIEGKADPNLKNKLGLTALHVAAEKGKLNILKDLINVGGADPSQPVDQDETQNNKKSRSE